MRMIRATSTAHYRRRPRVVDVNDLGCRPTPHHSGVDDER